MVSGAAARSEHARTADSGNKHEGREGCRLWWMFPALLVFNASLAAWVNEDVTCGGGGGGVRFQNRARAGEGVIQQPGHISSS